MHPTKLSVMNNKMNYMKKKLNLSDLNAIP